MRASCVSRSSARFAGRHYRSRVAAPTVPSWDEDYVFVPSPARPVRSGHPREYGRPALHPACYRMAPGTRAMRLIRSWLGRLSAVFAGGAAR